MRDTELYRYLLGLLEPWTVERVELNVTARRVDVWVSHPAGVTAQLGVDEKAAAKGHTYLTLVCNLAQGTVEYLTEDRKQASLDRLRACLRRSAWG